MDRNSEINQLKDFLNEEKHLERYGNCWICDDYESGFKMGMIHAAAINLTSKEVFE